jgi:hypothetical protein
MKVWELDITVFNDGEEVGTAGAMVAAGTEEQARLVCDRYLEEVCPLWDDRLHYKGYDYDIEEAESAEPDDVVWYLLSNNGEDDPQKMELISGEFSDFNNTSGLAP